jgi:hypothetical protein
LAVISTSTYCMKNRVEIWKTKPIPILFKVTVMARKK